MAPPASARPDVLIIVLDCARVQDFVEGRSAGERLPFLESLLRESEVYPRATTPAPWTVPSHASLFTGIYPWEHGCHAKSGLVLDPTIPRLPVALAASGYRTLSLSANHLICPELGMVEGYEQSAWAGWWEPYLRIGGTQLPPNVSGNGVGGEVAPGRIERAGTAWKLIKRSSRLAYRYPFLLDGLGRFATRFRTGDGHLDVPVSPWIEPTLDRWLSRIPRDQPLFSFVNLLETHEPYYPDAELAPGLLSWWEYSTTRQDHVGWLAGRWDPTAPEYARLHRLYRRSFLAADRRLARIAELFDRHGRWENSLVIVTSDHGQAFGEQGVLFHMLRLNEALVRVPLVVRRPNGEGGGSRAKGWASLIDIAPTILEGTGEQGALVTSGIPLDRLLDAPRPEPVFSAADGLVWRTIVPEHERANVSQQRMADLDRVLVCAYQDDVKVVYDATDARARAYDLGHDPFETSSRAPEEIPGALDLSALLPTVARRMVDGNHTEVSADVEDRLRSWGYL